MVNRLSVRLNISIAFIFHAGPVPPCYWFSLGQLAQLAHYHRGESELTPQAVAKAAACIPYRRRCANVNGKSVPSAAALASIADALGVSMDYLWGRDCPDNSIGHDSTTESDAPRKLAEIAALLPQFSALNAAMSKILANSYAPSRSRKKQ